MVVKIAKSGSNYSGALDYNQKKVNKGEAKIIDSQLILNKDNPEKAAKEFESMTKHYTKRKVMHISISFHPHDKHKLDDEKMAEIGKKYLRKMKMGEQPYITYRHDDTAHPHIHIITSRVNVHTHKMINDSHERRRSMRIAKELEQQYGLVIADKNQGHQASYKELRVEMEAIDKKMKIESDPEKKSNLEAYKKDVQQQIKAIHDVEKRAKEQSAAYRKSYQDIGRAVEKGLSNAPRTIKELNRQMAKDGSDIRIREIGKGIAYFREDETGKTSKLRKGSDFKDTAIDKQGIKYELDSINKNIRGMRNLIQKEQSSTLSGLENSLKKSGVTPKYSLAKKDDKVQLAGMSFEYQGKNYKASSIDKNLSWNKVKDNYSDKDNILVRELLRRIPEKDLTNDELAQRLEWHIQHKIGITAKFKGGRFNFQTVDKSLKKKLNELDNVDLFKAYKKGVESNDVNLAMKNIKSEINKLDRGKGIDRDWGIGR